MIKDTFVLCYNYSCVCNLLIICNVIMIRDDCGFMDNAGGVAMNTVILLLTPWVQKLISYWEAITNQPQVQFLVLIFCWLPMATVVNTPELYGWLHILTLLQEARLVFMLSCHLIKNSITLDWNKIWAWDLHRCAALIKAVKSLAPRM